METRACARRETSIRIAIEMALFPSAEGSHAQVDLHRHRCPQLWTSAWHHSPHDAQFGLNLKQIMMSVVSKPMLKHKWANKKRGLRESFITYKMKLRQGRVNRGDSITHVSIYVFKFSLGFNSQ